MSSRIEVTGEDKWIPAAPFRHINKSVTVVPLLVSFCRYMHDTGAEASIRNAHFEPQPATVQQRRLRLPRCNRRLRQHTNSMIMTVFLGAGLMLKPGFAKS